MNDADELEVALNELRHEIKSASSALAQHVKTHGDDPIAYAMADRILVAERQERLVRQALRNGELH